VVLLFLSGIRKKKITKRKTAGCRSRAKKSSHFPKRKELASLKQLFVLYGKYSIFLHALPRRPEEASFGGCHIASLKQLFVLHGKCPIFLHALPRRPEDASFGGCHIASLVGLVFFISL